MGTSVGSDQESFSSCPSGKYKDHLSASNIYELKCPQRDLIRMKWDKDSSDKSQASNYSESENLYACLNIECQEQFKGWIEGLVQSYLLLTAILFLACLFSCYLACKMKGFYQGAEPLSLIMWHDDVSLGFNVFFFLLILISATLIAQFHPDMVRVRQLIKFDHFTEFDKEKLGDGQFQLLKQEAMRIDNKLMQVDQRRFDILALQVNEDDSLCRPECVPLTYNVTISSIHGNVFVNIPNGNANLNEQHSSLFIKETKNELNMNLINFSGNLKDANYALQSMAFEPLCPLDSDNIIQLRVVAGASNGLEASGQLISMAIGQYKEIKGSGQTEIIDMPIYQHLSRSRNTLVIGKIVDSLLHGPVQNVTVQASMSGY